MKRRRAITPLLAFAVLAAHATIARAQNTQLLFEASTDAGQSWHSRVDAAPDSTVLVRLRVRIINVSPHETLILGLAGLTHQPTLSNWNPDIDARLDFSSPDGSAVPDDPPSNTGRIFPFASSGMSTSSASGLLTSHIDNGNTLRFAGANALTPTTNLFWGVASGQLPRSQRPSSFRYGLDPVVFRYAVRAGGNAERDMIAATDLRTVAVQRASWYRLPENVPESLLAPVRAEDILPATIHVIPAPSLLPALAHFLIHRRRLRRFASGLDAACLDAFFSPRERTVDVPPTCAVRGARRCEPSHASHAVPTKKRGPHKADPPLS